MYDWGVMKYVDSVQNSFSQVNTKLEDIIEFYDCIMDYDSELKEYVESLLEKTLIGYKSYLYKNNIPLDMIPRNIKEHMKKEKSYVKA